MSTFDDLFEDLVQEVVGKSTSGSRSDDMASITIKTFSEDDGCVMSQQQTQQASLPTTIEITVVVGKRRLVHTLEIDAKGRAKLE